MALPLVSLLIVSKRPALLPVILAMIARQTYTNYEIIIILHGVALDQIDADGLVAMERAAVVEAAPAAWSLGHCLNHASTRARGDLLAKIDDDDLYGAGYLAEAVAAQDSGVAEIIGKRESYYYFVREREMWLRFPSASLKYSTMLGGQSLVFPRRFAEAPGFRDISLSEDKYFVLDCLDAGARCYATSRRHLIIRRFTDGHDHTWPGTTISHDTILIRKDLVDDSPLGLLKLIGD